MPMAAAATQQQAVVSLPYCSSPGLSASKATSAPLYFDTMLLLQVQAVAGHWVCA
jgi:hypothetical protein